MHFSKTTPVSASSSVSRRAATRRRPQWWRGSPTGAAASSPMWCARNGRSIARTAGWCRRLPRAPVECLDLLIGEAMREADIDYSDLDAVAATAGPGLIGGLIVGLVTGKAIALAAQKPFIA